MRSMLFACVVAIAASCFTAHHSVGSRRFVEGDVTDADIDEIASVLRQRQPDLLSRPLLLAKYEPRYTAAMTVQVRLEFASEECAGRVRLRAVAFRRWSDWDVSWARPQIDGVFIHPGTACDEADALLAIAERERDKIDELTGGASVGRRPDSIGRAPSYSSREELGVGGKQVFSIVFHDGASLHEVLVGERRIIRNVVHVYTP